MPGPTPEQLAEFVSQPTPRPVPPVFAALTRRRSSRVAMIFGGIFLVAGLAFSAVFFPRRVIDTIRMSSGEPVQTDGNVTHSFETSYSVGGGEHSRGTPVHRHEFRFTTTSGREVSAISFETGRPRGDGEHVEIEYLAENPQIARIRGTRLNPFGVWSGLVVIFPIVGALVIFLPMRARRRRLRLLSHGVFTFAEVLDAKPTMVEVNNQKRYKVKIRFEADGLPQEVEIAAYGDDGRIAMERQEQGEKLGILYDPRRPRRCLFTARLIDGHPI